MRNANYSDEIAKNIISSFCMKHNDWISQAAPNVKDPLTFDQTREKDTTATIARLPNGVIYVVDIEQPEEK